VFCKVRNYYKTYQNKLNPGVGGAAFSTSFSVQGVATFDGEGRGTVYGRAASINPPSSLTLWIEGASSEKFSYEFFYKIGDDGEITTWLVPGSFKGTFLTGYLPGPDIHDPQENAFRRTSEDRLLIFAV